MRVTDESISALTNIITGNTINGNRRISPYRSGPQLITFFNQLGWNEEYAQGFPSRHVYVDMNLRQVNGTTIMNQIVVAAVDPRPFLGTEFSVEEVVNYLNQFLAYDGYELVREGLHYQVHRTQLGQERERARVKNIIFAANGPKPEIVLVDAINNDIEIVRHAQFCLVYEREITDNGLLWRELVQWWAEQANLGNYTEEEQSAHLRTRLDQSLSSEPERILFSAYYDTFLPQLGEGLPALIPQVYLHYDPQTVQQLAGNRRLIRQRMDFLLLLPHHRRVVVEVDGKQHYSVNDVASPRLYSEMVSEDRRLKLAGYDVFRFGGYEFVSENRRVQLIREFFQQLFAIHHVV